MTDLTPDDELLSAVADGDASADEVARVEADPELRARLARIGEISAAVGSRPTPPDGLADRVIGVALDQLEPAAPPVDELAARRAERVRRLAPVLAAAAAVVFVAVAAIAVNNDDADETAGRDASTDAASGSLEQGGDGATAAAELDEAPDSPAEFEADDAAAGAVAGGGGGGVGAPTADASLTRQGGFVVADGNDQFAAEVRDQLDGDPAPTTTAAIDDEGDGTEAVRDECDHRSAAARLMGDELLAGSGLLDGEPVTYRVFSTDDGPFLVVVDDTCAAVDRRLL